jgi:hypothetical protein
MGPGDFSQELFVIVEDPMVIVFHLVIWSCLTIRLRLLQEEKRHHKLKHDAQRKQLQDKARSDLREVRPCTDAPLCPLFFFLTAVVPLFGTAPFHLWHQIRDQHVALGRWTGTCKEIWCS